MDSPYRPILEVKTHEGTYTLLKCEIWTLVFYDFVLRQGLASTPKVFIDGREVYPPESIGDDE